jgi:dUTP pyrophosphatase
MQLPMQIKIKKLHENAVIPVYAKPGDAGMDMTCTNVNVAGQYWEYETGISMEIPEGYVGLLFPRSSNSKYALLLCNSVGVIDSGYRGPINFRYKQVGSGARYNIGDKVGQIMLLPYPKIQFVEAVELSDTERGEGGFGSTGA